MLPPRKRLVVRGYGRTNKERQSCVITTFAFFFSFGVCTCVACTGVSSE